MSEQIPAWATEIIERLERIEAAIQKLSGDTAKRIEPDAIYTVGEASTVTGISARTIRANLNLGIISGRRNGSYAPWAILGSELLKLGGGARG